MAKPSPTFVLRARLGRGGMGEVHLATMEQGGARETVALKRMRAELAETPEGLQQFEREARVEALLNHPHIVGLRAFGRDAQGPYLALEYVDGRSGSQLLLACEERSIQPPPEAVWQIALDVAQGLQHAHHLGREDAACVIHRDLSPDNVLVGFDGVTKVSDFGIAKLSGTTSFTTTGVVRGKHGYMAPELFDGATADVATDYFALAATLYKLWCGVTPFRGRTDAELLKAVLSAQPGQLSTLRAGVPENVERWIHAALEKDRARRPASLEPLVEALQASPASRGAVSELMARAFPNRELPELVAAPQKSGTMAVAAPAKPRRVRWPIAAASVVVVLAAGGAWLVTRAEETPAPAPPPVVVAAPEPEPPAPTPVPTPVPTPTPSEPPPKPAATPAPTFARGSLWVKVKPWGRVFVDGRLQGVTPLSPMPLPSGQHHVVVVNEKLQQTKTFTVEVKPGKQSELKVTLQE